MGKSTFATLMGRSGCRVVDTDDLARAVVEPGTLCADQVRAAFGDGVFHQAGHLDRSRMAELVFSDPVARVKLESILHPAIRSAWRAAFQSWLQEGVETAVVVIPLLFETGADKELDGTLCVACSPDTQRERLAGRGWNQEECDRRIRAQWPAEKKMEMARWVVWNEGKITNLEAQLVRILLK
jgi:dephospho-CoA kinase